MTGSEGDQFQPLGRMAVGAANGIIVQVKDGEVALDTDIMELLYSRFVTFRELHRLSQAELESLILIQHCSLRNTRIVAP